MVNKERDMTDTKPSRKMFLEVVQELRTLIGNENIRAGDKLPSERVLAERLGTGRSTIREALRSLELLGLIESRQGEGTFLSDFRKHQLVEVLAAFILQEPKSLEDVSATMRIHEKEAVRVSSGHTEIRTLPLWGSLIAAVESDDSYLREDIVREVLIASGNRLSLKIWHLLYQYAGKPYTGEAAADERTEIASMLRLIRSGETEKAVAAYDRWTEIVHAQRGNTDGDHPRDVQEK
jgi:GntR family transcriptional regulator, transcriptional repressor for pyruvate dehydrogenase complex